MLLIAVLVLLMATATATYAIQNTAYESRAAGVMRQAAQTRYAAEAGVQVVHTGVQAEAFSSNTLRSFDNFNALRSELCLPPRDPANQNWLQDANEATFATDARYVTDALPTDASLAPAGGRASEFVPSFNAMVELWKLKDDPKMVDYYWRYVATTYGRVAFPTESAAAGELRAAHTTISIAQAYYDQFPR